MNDNYFLSPTNSLYSQLQHDHYSKLEKELESLTNEEISQLLNYKPYNEANSTLQLIISAETIKLIRGQLNAYPDVINKCIDAIKDFKAQKDKRQKELLEDFQDYLTNYSDLTYNEYKQLKQ